MLPISFCWLSVHAHAVTPQEILGTYVSQAKQESASFKEASASHGEKFFRAARTHSSGKHMSCAICHTENPKGTGAHKKTRKEILPLAPAANKDRFTDPAKVEKRFKRNCQDVLERSCTAQEKSDFLAYLLSLK